MSSLIEQAAQRLEQLRQAGVEIPDVAPAPRAPGTARPDAGDTPAPRRIELDFAAIGATGIITPSAPRSALADQFRVVKRPLIANAMGRGAATLKHGNLIMVTSALAGEGKTFTAVNLAMSIAKELDHTVMLVDADVARPSVPQTLGFAPGPGLLDLLLGRAEMPGVLMRTNVDKLTILSSGTPHPRATELLASEAMSRLLDDIATRYADRIVIFDSPPLLLTTESRVLASHMGQVVVVVQAGKTPQADVEHALATIEACPVRLMLLNQARSSDQEAYGYGYGYGYGHGHGHGHGGEADTPSPKAA